MILAQHSLGLLVGYGIALALWAGLLRWRPDVWPRTDGHPFERPWLEVGWALLGGVGVLLVGQLYARGIRLPASGGGALRPLAESVNQIIIFAPMLALLPLRHHALETAWVRRDRVAVRIAIGVVLATIAIAAFTAVQRDAPSLGTIISRVYRPANTHIAVQVLLEDIAIALLMVRFAAAIGSRRAILVVAALFAAGHIPALLATGSTPTELVLLVRDAALAAGVLAVALRGADVWVVWPIHFAMDMMQFAISGRQP